MKLKILRIAFVSALVALTATVAPLPAHAAAAPTTSPAAASRVFQSNPYYDCADGYVCATVPYGSGWYLFKFYKYGTYYLSNWYGHGDVFNSQTDGAAVRLYDGAGNQTECIPGPDDYWGDYAHYDDDVNWTPLWSIRLTANNC